MKNSMREKKTKKSKLKFLIKKKMKKDNEHKEKKKWFCMV